MAEAMLGDEDDLDRGFGTDMMRLAIERCFADRPSLRCSSIHSPPTRARIASTSASALGASSGDIFSETTIASSIALHAPTKRRLGNLV